MITLEQMQETLKFYAEDSVRNSRQSEKNFYANRNKILREIKKTLEANQFKYEKEEVLDITQGETGEFIYTIAPPENLKLAESIEKWTNKKAVAYIYSLEEAFVIPSSGGKPKLLNLKQMKIYNLVKYAVEYGLF